MELKKIVGLDLTEEQFDIVNAEKTAAIRNSADFDDPLFTSYAIKNCRTAKGFWMQIVTGYEHIFSPEQLDSAVEYVPLIEQEEATYEV